MGYQIINIISAITSVISAYFFIENAVLMNWGKAVFWIIITILSLTPLENTRKINDEKI